MSLKNLIKTIPMIIWVRVVGVLLVIFYSFVIAIAYWTVGPYNIEFLLFLASLIAAIGVLYNKEFARKALLIISAVGVGYIIFDSLFSKGIDELSILFALLFFSVIVFYRQSYIKAVFVAPLVQRSSHSWNILLIDDDKVLAKILNRSFLQKGVILLNAQTGERGLSIAQTQKVDLIILDVILPGMKGREVCQQLKEDSRTKDIPIVFLTVKDSPDDIQAEMEAGAVSHLTKPVDFQNLYQEIKKILGE